MSFAQLEEAAKQQMQEGDQAEDGQDASRIGDKRGSVQKGAASKKGKPAVP